MNKIKFEVIIITIFIIFMIISTRNCAYLNILNENNIRSEYKGSIFFVDRNEILKICKKHNIIIKHKIYF